MQEQSPVIKSMHPRSNTAYSRKPYNSDDEDDDNDLLP